MSRKEATARELGGRPRDCFKKDRKWSAVLNNAETAKDENK